MDGLKDVFTPFYERLRRPFIGAYWIAVITYNWKVWTALFFYKEKVNGVDKIEYISKQLGWMNLLLCPLSLAVAFIFLGALLDWGVFYYQEWVRSKKRSVREKFERTRMVPSETFLRVQNERETFKNQFTKAETDITELKKEMYKLHDYSKENEELRLQPNENYFAGKWDILLPQLPALELIIKNSRIELRFKDEIEHPVNNKDPYSTRDIQQYVRTVNEIIVIFKTQKNTTPEGLKLAFPKVIDAENLIHLFSSQQTIWRIPIQHIRTEDFAVNNQENGTQVVFRRQSTWNSTMHLWMGEAKEFPIPISTFPK